VKNKKMNTKKEEVHSARILKNGFFAVALVMVLFAVSVAPVSAADGDNNVTPESIGSGTGFVKPVGIAVEVDGSLVVVDQGLNAVVRVNPINGNRTIVSDASTGSGTGFVTPVGIAVEADSSLVVVDRGLDAVVRVNPINGDRTVVSDAHTGSGTGFVKPVGIAVEADGSLVVVDDGLVAVVRVNPISGNRTVVSDVSETKENVIKPLIITETVKHDTDDPAIWLNPKDPSKSLIIGTDKDRDGALYVFGLDGKIIEQKTVRNLKRPNNVDIEYGLILNGIPTDIVVVTERSENKIRVFSLPDMKSIDNGGIEVFIGEEQRAPMGIALYKRSSDGVIFAIVGRKSGPTDGRYLWQYQLEDDGRGYVTGTKVREFGFFSGEKEIEAIAVDDALGYVYYSDENIGIRKYYADPDIENANKELALFGTTGFAEDREGISIYTINDGTGYILVSDQQANAFRIFKREGESGDPHIHQLVKVVNASTKESDGSDVTNAVLNDTFPVGLFVAMSDDKTFQLYSWADIAGDDLCIAPDGELVEHP